MKVINVARVTLRNPVDRGERDARALPLHGSLADVSAVCVAACVATAPDQALANLHTLCNPRGAACGGGCRRHRRRCPATSGDSSEPRPPIGSIRVCIFALSMFPVRGAIDAKDYAASDLAIRRHNLIASPDERLAHPLPRELKSLSSCNRCDSRSSRSVPGAAAVRSKSIPPGLPILFAGTTTWSTNAARERTGERSRVAASSSNEHA